MKRSAIVKEALRRTKDERYVRTGPEFIITDYSNSEKEGMLCDRICTLPTAWCRCGQISLGAGLNEIIEWCRRFLEKGVHL